MLRSFLALLIACCFSALATAQIPKAPEAKRATQQKIIIHAKQAYYGLRALGLDEFQSTVKPNWEVLLKDQLKSDPAAGQSGLKLLNGLHFSMLLDKNGKVTVGHHADIEPSNEQQRQGLNQIYSGLEQTLSGFFETWSLFMLTNPLPSADGEYLLEDLGAQYRLSYKDGSADVVTLMSKDLVITEIIVTTAEFASSVRPQLAKTTKGLILAGYTGDYKPAKGEGAVKLNVKLEHRLVNGFELPVSLVMDSLYDGAPTHMELAFSEHQVKSH